MKYTLEGFSQEAAVKLGLGIEHLVILRWFIDFRQTERMASVIMEGQEYFWVKYQAVAEDLPILSISKDRIYRKFKELTEAKVLIHKPVQAGGTFSYYGIGENYLSLVKNTEPSVKTTEGTVKIPEGTVKIPEGTVKIPEQIDQSTISIYKNNSSIRNTYSARNEKNSIQGEKNTELLEQKSSIDLEAKEQSKKVPPPRAQKIAFQPPTEEEVIDYVLSTNKMSRLPEAQNLAERFVAYYESIGWTVGKAKAPMKDWRGSVRTWLLRDKDDGRKVISIDEQDRQARHDKLAKFEAEMKKRGVI